MNIRREKRPITQQIKMKLRSQQESALRALSEQNRGIVAIATGGGKTLVQIRDSQRQFNSSDTPKTVAVVAPRIALATQLSIEYGKHIDNARFLHVHTKKGKTKHYHTTNEKVIKEWVEIHKEHHKLIFTTYHSLKKIYKSEINVDTFMFDESHNSTSAGFHEYVKAVSETTKRCFHFSATPKFSKMANKPGMNDSSIYGGIIARASAADLIKDGHILKPRIIKHPLEWIQDRTAQHDANDILEIIKEHDLSKLLINVRKAKYIMDMLTETDFQEQLENLGYDLLHITSQYGAFHNGKKIQREKFFELLETLGDSIDKKYVILNYSILGEGINVKSLDAVLLMRSPDLIKLVQCIGRTLRLSEQDSRAIENGELQVGDYENYLKPEGLVIVPVYNKKLMNAANYITETIQDVYVNGEIPIMTT